MTAFLATLQQAAVWVHAQVAALWNILSAIGANRPEPARNVVVYTLASAVILAVAPTIIKKLR